MVIETQELLKAGNTTTKSSTNCWYRLKIQTDWTVAAVAAIRLAAPPPEGCCFNSTNDQIYLPIAPQLLQLTALFITALWCGFWVIFICRAAYKSAIQERWCGQLSLPVEAEPQLIEGQNMQLEEGNDFSCQSLPHLCLQVNTLNF